MSTNPTFAHFLPIFTIYETKTFFKALKNPQMIQFQENVCIDWQMSGRNSTLYDPSDYRRWSKKRPQPKDNKWKNELRIGANKTTQILTINEVHSKENIEK